MIAIHHAHLSTSHPSTHTKGFGGCGVQIFFRVQAEPKDEPTKCNGRLEQSPAHTPYTPTSKISFGLITLYTISQVTMLSTHLQANVLSRLCSIKNASSKLNSFLGELTLDNNPMQIIISYFHLKLDKRFKSCIWYLHIHVKYNSAQIKNESTEWRCDMYRMQFYRLSYL